MKKKNWGMGGNCPRPDVRSRTIRDYLPKQRIIVTSETCCHNRLIVRSKAYSHIRDYLPQQRLLVTSETFCHNRNLLSHQTLKSLVVTTKVLRC